MHGAKEDVSKLITSTVELFDENEELRIKHFTSVWKEMRFGLIFHGRQSYRELHEFAENLLEMVKTFCLSPQEFGTTAAALYLLYVLYFKQPLRPKVKIRLEYK